MTFPVKKNYFLLLIVLLITTVGCKKYLDAKSDQKLAFPDRLEDVQALLDDFIVLNERGLSTGEASADNYFKR